MKKFFALFALIALLGTPAFADDLSDNSANVNIDLTIETYATVSLTMTDTNDPWGAVTNGTSPADTKSWDATWECNFAADLTFVLANTTGDFYSIPNPSTAVIGPTVDGGDGVETVDVTRRAITLADAAGDYGATLTVSITAQAE